MKPTAKKKSPTMPEPSEALKWILMNVDYNKIPKCPPVVEEWLAANLTDEEKAND